MKEVVALREVPLKRGGTARLVAVDLERATVDVPNAAPPGSTLELVVAEAPLAIKVKSCRKLEEGDAFAYRVEGRWVNLPRAQREALGLSAPSA